jgi:hypothetical protein
MTSKQRQTIETLCNREIAMKSPNPSFTQNKWLLVNDGIVWNIVDEGGWSICTVSNANREPAVTNALAHLIRSAPELLAVVNSCMRAFHERLDVLQDERRERLRYVDDTDDIDYQIDRIRSVVRKCDFVVGLAERLGVAKPCQETIPSILPKSPFEKE